MSLIGSTHAATAAPPVDAAPSTTVWSTPARTESGVARVREATAGEVEGGAPLVARFWNHRVTHRRSWIESLAGSGGGEPLYLVWEKHGEVVGCMPGLLARVGLWRGFGSPLPGWQTVSLGPVWDLGRVWGRREGAPSFPPPPPPAGGPPLPPRPKEPAPPQRAARRAARALRPDRGR